MLAVWSLTLLSVPLSQKMQQCKSQVEPCLVSAPILILIVCAWSSFSFFFSLSIVFWFVIGWLQFSTGRTGWFASQTPPLGVAGEIFHIQKIFSCKVAHSPIVNIKCHIAILFKMCSECTT